MKMRTMKIPSTIEYVLFPAERYFRHLHEETKEETRTDLNYKEEENAWKQKRMMERKKRRDESEGKRKTSAFSVVRDNLLSR